MAAFTVAAWLLSPGTLKVSSRSTAPRCPSLVAPRRATWRPSARRQFGRRGRQSRSRWQLVVTLAFCAGLVTFLLQTLTDDHFERSFLHHWHRWWRRHRSWFRGDRLAILIALLLALLSAPQRAQRRRLEQPRRAVRSAPARVVRAPVMQAQRSIGERRQSALDQLHAALQEGDALRAAILIDTWGQGDTSVSLEPLQRPELQILLEEAARHAPQLLPVLAEQLEQRGVLLDWALGNDCRANFGRYALDAALEVLVKETRNEPAALSLLSLGEGSGKGDTSQLDADPLMRAAAAQGMTRLVEKLVKDCGADVNSKDPRFGSSALDRALDAGKEQTSLKLLELGADPTAGKGVDYILARAGPKVRSELPKRMGGTMSQAQEGSTSEVDFAKLRVQLQKMSERMVLQQLEKKRLSKVQLAQLLQETARIGYRPRLLQCLCDNLGKEAEAIASDATFARRPMEAEAIASDATFARRPMEVALETAVEENPDPRTAEWLLDEGIRGLGSTAILCCAQLPVGEPNVDVILKGCGVCRCQVSLVRRLVEVKADPSAPDPRYGSTALDRAVSAGLLGTRADEKPKARACS